MPEPDRTWWHVYVCEPPARIVTSPLGEIPVHFASLSGLNFSVMLPVFLTMISYSTVWPSLPLSGSCVKPGSPSIFWSFSIVYDGSAIFTTTSLEVFVPVPSLPSMLAVFP